MSGHILGWSKCTRCGTEGVPSRVACDCWDDIKEARAMKLTISQVKGHNRRLRSEREELVKVLKETADALEGIADDVGFLTLSETQAITKAHATLAKCEGRSTGEGM